MLTTFRPHVSPADLRPADKGKGRGDVGKDADEGNEGDDEGNDEGDDSDAEAWAEAENIPQEWMMIPTDNHEESDEGDEGDEDDGKVAEQPGP